MRDVNFLNLNVTRDPNAGPDRYTVEVALYYGEDRKETTMDTNVRDTSTPDNAAYFQVIDYIHDNLIGYALSHYECYDEFLDHQYIATTCN